MLYVKDMNFLSTFPINSKINFEINQNFMSLLPMLLSTLLLMLDK